MQTELWKLPPTFGRSSFLGDYLPRKCGIATFTSDVLSAVAAEHPQTQCIAVPVTTFATLSLDAVLAAME